MKAALSVIVTAMTFSAGMTLSHAQEPTATPDLATPPAGEFHVEPSSGPVGTTVTLTGNLDQPIRSIRFVCVYRDTHDEGIYDQSLESLRSSFSVQIVIPERLGLRQRGGETRETLIGTCEFRGIASHQLLYASTPFTVTAGLPSTGSHGGSSGGSAAPLLGLLLAGAVLLSLGWAVRARPAVLVQIHG